MSSEAEVRERSKRNHYAGAFLINLGMATNETSVVEQGTQLIEFGDVMRVDVSVVLREVTDKLAEKHPDITEICTHIATKMMLGL